VPLFSFFASRQLPTAPAPVPRPVQPAPASGPRLSVVLVNYRQWENTWRLADQLLLSACTGSGAAELIVVDNHSPRTPAQSRLAAVLRRRDGVSLRCWGRNRGFARAANEGCRLGRGAWLLLLNPDMSVPPGFLDGVQALAARLAAEARVGIVGLQLRNGDGSRQLSAGPCPTLAGTLARLLLPRAWRKYRWLGSGRGQEVAWVTGCCLLVRRECFEQLGGFDRNFFLYYEDVDLCRRARELGWSVRYEPGLHLTHHAPLHARRVSAPLLACTRHALLTYAARHWPGWQFRVLARLIGLEASWRRRVALGRKDVRSAAVFAELEKIIRLVAQRRPRRAWRALERLMNAPEDRR
jgi:N-acetylglucosaminyl-diphospho-decaprenol L-rhamnosyltransferase